MATQHYVESDQDWKNAEYSFCPKCGGGLRHRVIKVDEPKRLVCQVCGYVFFLDPKVAAGVIVSLDEGLLLVRRGIEPAYGKWVFPGGFVDRGETVEEAAVRETREESRLDVRISRLLNIYSYHNHPVIIIVYVGEVVGGQVAAGDETLEAQLFPHHAIPWDQLAFASTGQALREYLNSIAW